MLFILVLLLAVATAAGASTLPPGFTETLLADDLDGATALDVLPDGRILIAEQRGTVRIVPAAGGNAQTVHQLSADNRTGERGLLGIVVDPDFEANGFVYVYYTTDDGGLHNRLSRFRLQGSTVSGETALHEFQGFSESIFHMGGAMRFAADGALLVGVGDHFLGEPAQDLGSDFGKLHRFAAGGSIPPDNPFVAQAGARPSIWAYGLRNPYSVDVDPENGDILINDVGELRWEEVDLGAAGADYGWPDSEGPPVGPGEVAPIYAYRHQGGACAIVGGVSYPAAGPFPEPFAGGYQIVDLCAGWIRSLDRATGVVTGLATDLEFPTALRLDREGRLLYLSRESDGGGNVPGKLYRIAYNGDPSLLPQIVEQPADTTAGVGETASFTVAASGALTYQWQRDGANLAGENSATLAVEAVTPADDGARFRVRVANAYGSVLSAEARLTVIANLAPQVSISSPLPGSGYAIGTHLALAGSAIDPEDGAVPPARLSWRVDLHHDTHVHPLMPEQGGSATVDFTVPPEAAHGDGIVWLEAVLTATDLGGRSASRSVHVFPQSALDGDEETILALGPATHLVSLEFQNPHTGVPQSGVALPQTVDSGGFWFFAEANLEMLIKVIDGGGFNGCRWIFAGGLTDVEWQLLIVETATGSKRVYSNPSGTQASFGDIEAFCAGAPAAALVAAPAGSGGGSLALLDGRFAVRVDWRNPWTGASGSGSASPFTDESGFFTFFSPGNLEMAVKMVDGSAFNGHFWLYWTALTNLETTLVVEDLDTGRIRTFPKTGSTFGAGADILAFPAD